MGGWVIHVGRIRRLTSVSLGVPILTVRQRLIGLRRSPSTGFMAAWLWRRRGGSVGVERGIHLVSWCLESLLLHERGVNIVEFVSPVRSTDMLSNPLALHLS